MKKTAIITICSIGLLAILYKSGVISALAYFILVGVVPGTNYTVPSTLMLLLMTGAAWVIIFSFVPIDLFKTADDHKKSPPKTSITKTSLRTNLKQFFLP